MITVNKNGDHGIFEGKRGDSVHRNSCMVRMNMKYEIYIKILYFLLKRIVCECFYLLIMIMIIQ